MYWLRARGREPKHRLGRAEEQTKKFIVDTFRGAEDGGQEADIAIVSNHRIMSMLLCRSAFLQRLADPVRVRASEAAVLIISNLKRLTAHA